MEFNDDYTLEKDGLVAEYSLYNQSEEGKGFSGSITIEYFTDFQLDIENGLKTYEASLSSKTEDNNNVQKETIENPNTGVNNYTIIAAIVITIGAITFISTRKKNIFPHV